MRKSNFLSTISVIVLLAVYLQSAANAQTFIIKDIPHDRLSADFRFIHPFYKSPGSLSGLSGTYD